MAPAVSVLGGCNHGGVLVVDAYNVLHTQGILPPHLAGPEVHELIEMIGASRYKRHRAIVVCDGVPGSDVSSRAARGTTNEASVRRARDERRGEATVDVVFAGPGREADEAIETLLESHSAARRMLVVSTDRRVRRAANRAGATSLTSTEFLRHLAADLDRHKVGRGGAGLSHRPSFATDLPLSRLEVAYWLAHMGIEGEAAAPGPVTPLTGRSPVDAEIARGAAEKRPDDGRVARKSPMRSADGSPQNVEGNRQVGPAPGQESRGEAANTHAGGAHDATPQWMHEAARAWAGRLNLEELDTGKWLNSPLAPESRKHEPPSHPQRSSSVRRKK